MKKPRTNRDSSAGALAFGCAYQRLVVCIHSLCIYNNNNHKQIVGQFTPDNAGNGVDDAD